jgi:SAM-dependent methyltransferase
MEKRKNQPACATLRFIMWLDVIDLRDFYESSLGLVARRLIRRRIRGLWPDLTGQRVLGVGFATPYLRPFQREAERVCAVMPAGQGVLHWPPDEPNLVALGEEISLPFPDRSFDRIFLAHALEHSEQSRLLMREMWRVLSDGGRMIVMVPNRQGLWSHLEQTPFASGQPYSAQQLRRLLRDCMFTPLQSDGALFIPPMRSRILLPWAGALEEVGLRWLKRLAGVVLVEAAKQIYAAPDDKQRVRGRRPAYLPVPNGVRMSGRNKHGELVHNRNPEQGQ